MCSFNHRISFDGTNHIQIYGDEDGAPLSSTSPLNTSEVGGALPEHEVDADHTLRLGVLVVVDDGGLRLHPHKAPPPGQHAVLPRADLPLGEHYDQGERKRRIKPVRTRSSRRQAAGCGWTALRLWWVLVRWSESRAW